MASYVPQGRHHKKPWKARIKREGIEFFLGYFPTEHQASEAEQQFSSHYHSRRGKYRNA